MVSGLILGLGSYIFKNRNILRCFMNNVGKDFNLAIQGFNKKISNDKYGNLTSNPR